MIRRLFLIVFVFAVTTTAGFYVKAQTNEVAPEQALPQSVLKPLPPPENPRESFKYLASLSYSALELPIPNKFGATVGMITSQKQTWELEYMSGSLSVPGGFRDLGSVSDARLGLVGRTFLGKSFHVNYGVSFFDFSADIGSELIKNVSNGVYPSMNALHIQGLGLNAGLGNTWVFKKKITFGVDWLSWAQPVIITRRSSDFIKNSNNQATNKYVDDTMKIVSYLPRLAMIHLHVGMLF